MGAHERARVAGGRDRRQVAPETIASVPGQPFVSFFFFAFAWQALSDFLHFLDLYP